MAKETRESTPAEKTLLDLRQKIEVATAADTKTSTATTKKALADLETQIKTAQKVVNREKFIRVAGGRVKKARIAIKNLANVAVPRTYEYSEEDVSKAESALLSQVKSTIDKLRSALTKGSSAAKSDDDFSF